MAQGADGDRGQRAGSLMPMAHGGKAVAQDHQRYPAMGVDGVGLPVQTATAGIVDPVQVAAGSVGVLDRQTRGIGKGLQPALAVVGTGDREALAADDGDGLGIAPEAVVIQQLFEAGAIYGIQRADAFAVIVSGGDAFGFAALDLVLPADRAAVKHRYSVSTLVVVCLVPTLPDLENQARRLRQAALDQWPINEVLTCPLDEETTLFLSLSRASLLQTEAFTGWLAERWRMPQTAPA